MSYQIITVNVKNPNIFLDREETTMFESIVENNEVFEQIGRLYSYLGFKCLQGDVEAMKFLYSNIHLEHPPVIETVNLLQYNISPIDIIEDNKGVYNNKWLYYWGMTCLRELSDLTEQRLDISEVCFEKIQKDVPKAEARLAYIKLLKSGDPTKEDENVRNIRLLKKWAGRKDIFSMIVLARITHHSFISKKDPAEPGLSQTAIHLLVHPCQMGHPVAIRLWNEIMESYDRENSGQFYVGMSDKFIEESRINANILYDY